MTYDINKISVINEKIYIQGRHWDGYGRPEYIDIEILDSKSAFEWAKILYEAAQESSINEKQIIENRLNKLKEKRDNLIKQIEEYEKRNA